MGFLITTDGTLGSTQVPNEIILNHILKASGENAKIYLYLLMASQNPGITGQVSVESLADTLDLTERDIIRSLHYWERDCLLSLTEEQGEIVGISLTQPSTAPYPYERTFTETGTPHLKVVDKKPDNDEYELSSIDIPERIQYTPMQIEALSKDIEMKKTLTSVESTLKSPISASHLQLIMYLICDLGFSSDLVGYLYGMCYERSKTNPKYIEAIAINWAKKGISTVDEAMKEVGDFTGKYRPIKKALGIHRDFAPAEKEIIDSWDEYHFSDEIIEEACKRTVIQSGDTNLNYVGKILKGWHDKGVKTLSDIKAADEAYIKAKKSASKPTPVRKRTTNSFNNFKGRDYTDEDYENMELSFLRRKGTP